MLGILLTRTFRELRRKLKYTVIVVGGLALGITTFLVIVQWSAWHLSYDRYFTGYEDIYRLSLKETGENFERHTARIIHGDVVQLLYNRPEIPEILSSARLVPFRNAIVRRGDVYFYEEKAYSCDPGFLDLFRPKMRVGNPSTALVGPGRLILSEDAARKYFGDEDPVGKTLEIIHQFGIDGELYEITGVFRNFPKNSHFRIDFLTSMEDPQEYNGTAWMYLKMQPGAETGQVEERIKAFIIENINEKWTQGLEPWVIPVSDIHLKSNLARELEQNIPMLTLIILLVAGLLVFVLAWFNFTLLNISQNQLNINRLIYQWQSGASRKTFFIQFFVDFMTIGILSFIFALLLSLLVNSPLSNEFHVSLLENRKIYILSMGVILSVLLVSSLLTSWFAMRRLYGVLKYRYFSSNKASRRPLNNRNLFIRFVIVIEFVITYVLVANLYMIKKQVDFSIGQQIGSKDETTIQIPNLPRTIINNYKLFKTELEKYPVFKQVTAMMEEPGGMAMDAFHFRVEGLPVTDEMLYVFPVDEDFLRFYDLRILAGGDFPTEYDTEDTTEFFVLNETAAKLANVSDYDELIGKELDIDFAYDGYIYAGDIVGVIEDFHLSSSEMAVTPMVIFPEYTWLYCISLRINGKPEDALNVLQKEWREFFPRYPLQYVFTEDLYRNLYGTQLTVLKILVVFGIISMLIAGTGLFGLSSFFMQKKVHAAAIRKIHGAGMVNILVPELLQYLFLSVMSTIVAIPLTVFTINLWLSNFAYQVSIQPLMMGIIGLILVLLSWVAVLYHSIKLARFNPILFIRNE